jgi:DNA sulfur modification protein DndD
MSAIIDKIKLENWYNYRGKYENNTIQLGEGLNVIVGDNNGGKTKLHNAIRFILENKVVFKREEKYVKLKIDSTNIKEVINERAYPELEIDKTIILGVKLYFKLTLRGETTTRVLKREIKIRKTIEGPKILEETEGVYLVNNHTDYETHEKQAEFNCLCNLLFPERNRNYFFLDGEQLGLMTPFSGSELKKTINSIINLGDVDKIVDNFIKISTSIKNKKAAILEDNEDLTDEEEQIAERLKALPELIQAVEGSIDSINEQLANQEQIKKQYEDQAAREKESLDILEQFNLLKGKRDIAENEYFSVERNYIAKYFDKYFFGLAYFNNDESNENNLGTYINRIKSAITERKTELDNSISKDDAFMMNALDRSQPKPEILKEMVHFHKCFICKAELNKESEDWILNKLIPFFKNDNPHEEDPSLQKLMMVKELTAQMFNFSKKHFKYDINVLKHSDEDVLDALEKFKNAKKNLENFINQNGDPEANNSETVALHTYGEAIKKISKLERDLVLENKNLSDLITEQKNCITSLSSTSNDKIKQNLEKIDDLDGFLDDVKTKLEQIKEERYIKFSYDLSEKATSRFRSFFKRNVNTKKQEIKVDLITTQTQKGKIFNFEIKVINSFGEDQLNAGGASQAMRQVAVVFGLIDISGSSSCPFIVDAPTSDLSAPQKESFFEQIGQDQALRQTILLTMDLLDETGLKLNDLGHKVLKNIISKDDSKMIQLIGVGENNGVNINYLN